MKHFVATMMFLFLNFSHAQEVDKTLEAVGKLNELVCIPKKSPTQFSGYSCQELLSDVPPQWIGRNDKLGFFKNPNTWAPVCAFSRLDQLKLEKPNATQAGLTKVLGEVQGDYDLCGSGEDRSSAAYHAPSLETASKEAKETIKVLSDSERVQVEKNVKVIQAASAESCCGADLVCTKLMNSVSTVFCEVQKDPTQADECIESGTYFRAYAVNEWRKKPLVQVTGKLPIKPGIMTLSPYKALPFDHIAHEFGHACSWTKRMLAVKSGARPEYGEFGLDEACTVNAAVTLTYEHLVTQAGFSVESNQCISARANTAKRARYSLKKCPNGCEKDQYEEAMADFYSYRVANNSDFIPTYLPNTICEGAREGDHMLVTDIFSCALKTQAFRARIEEITQCAK